MSGEWQWRCESESEETLLALINVISDDKIEYIFSRYGTKLGSKCMCVYVNGK